MGKPAADSALRWLQDYATALKHGSIKPYSTTERKARAATRKHSWGPTGTELCHLADLTREPTDCDIILHVVELRLKYPPRKWRNVYKALTVLEYLLRHGSEACVARARGALAPRLASLAEDFEHTAPDGRDVGLGVRHRAQAIMQLARDERRLAAERAASARKRGQYQGFGSLDLQARGGPRPQAAAPGWRADPQGSAHPVQPEVAVPRSAWRPDSPGYREKVVGERPRNAGETKGVSMEENQRYLGALRCLLDLPSNRTCADCAGSGAVGRSSWASINCGVFICLRCAGVHRSLGVHVSKVRSCTLDTWLPEQVEFMALTGNGRANAYWEARLPPGAKPTAESATLQELEDFVRRKYVAREFAEGVWPPEQLRAGPEVAAVLADSLGPARAQALLAAAAVEPRQRLPLMSATAEEAATSQAALADDWIEFDVEWLDGTPEGSTDSLAVAEAPGDPLSGLADAFPSPTTTLHRPQSSFALSDSSDWERGWEPSATFGAQHKAALTSARKPAVSAAARPIAVPLPTSAFSRPSFEPPQAAQAPQGRRRASKLQLFPAGQAYDPAFGTGTAVLVDDFLPRPSASLSDETQPPDIAFAHAFNSSGGTSRYVQLQARSALSAVKAKAQELLSRDPPAYDLHAETLLAAGGRKSARFPSDPQLTAPLLAIESTS